MRNTNKARQELQNIAREIISEDFPTLESWRNFRDALWTGSATVDEDVKKWVDNFKPLLEDFKNNETKKQLTDILTNYEKGAAETIKATNKAIKKDLIFKGVKSCEINKEVIKDLLKKRELFCGCGMVGNKPITIEKLKNNKPSYLTEYDENKRNIKGLSWFYIIEVDKEQTAARHLWSYDFICCDINSGKAEKLTSPIMHNCSRSPSFKKLESYWRKSDYETARKCAKNIFCVSQVSNFADIIKKQTERAKHNNELQTIRYHRHDLSKAQFDKTTRTYKETKCGYYYYTNNRFDIFDVSGWNLSEKREELKYKAQQLKQQRDKERLTATRCEEEIAKMTQLTFDLIASLDQLTAMLKNYLINNKKIRLFWLQTRIERTTDKIADICELKKDFENKNEVFNNIAQMMEKYEKRTTAAKHTLQLNKIYLAMSEEEHADTNSAKNNAIYYGYYNDINSQIILDIEKAQNELNKRNY